MCGSGARGHYYHLLKGVRFGRLGFTHYKWSRQWLGSPPSLGPPRCTNEHNVILVFVVTHTIMVFHNSHVCTTAILVKARSLSLSDLQTHPPEAREDRSSAKSTNGSVPSHLRHGRGGVGPSGITCDRNLPSRDKPLGRPTCQRVMR